MEHMYYGRHDNIKPRVGVHIFMIDEHVRKILTNAEERFNENLNAIMIVFKKEALAGLHNHTNQINKLQTKLESLDKRFKDYKAKVDAEKKADNKTIEEEYHSIKKILNKKKYNNTM